MHGPRCNLFVAIAIQGRAGSRNTPMTRLSNAEFFAVIVSLASIGIAVLGNRTQERLLAASVWPYLSFTSGNTSDDGQQKVVAVTVTNSGNGPARVRRFTLDYDGQPAASARGLLERCCGMVPDLVVTSPIVGRVLRPGEQINVLQVPYAASIADGWKKLDRARFRFVYSACYCSTLGECWETRSDRDEPAPVEACPAMPAEAQWHG